PVQAPSLAALRRAHQRGGLRLLRDARPDLPEPFVRVVDRALAPPGERFTSAGALQAALAACLGIAPSSPAPPLRVPRRNWLWAATACLLSAGAAVLLYLLYLQRNAHVVTPEALRAAPEEEAEALQLEQAGLLQLAMGSYADARALHERALALRERGFG